ncbi:unnamed protein product, partial [Mesorhabditis belari]|uniref:Uncharacterized protein n=1 Tax=Mesorhabditis belari TaxID=2138241 RepID=A0AAF3F3P3_9BILA
MKRTHETDQELEERLAKRRELVSRMVARQKQSEAERTKNGGIGNWFYDLPPLQFIAAGAVAVSAALIYYYYQNR